MISNHAGEDDHHVLEEFMHCYAGNSNSNFVIRNILGTCVPHFNLNGNSNRISLALFPHRKVAAVTSEMPFVTFDVFCDNCLI